MTAIQNFSEPKTLKRIAALVVAAGVLTAGSASAMTAGTYTSTVQGRNGNITVEVKVSATKIESVRVTDQKETLDRVACREEHSGSGGRGSDRAGG